MKIKEIVINKFRGLQDIKVNSIGSINELYGSNGSGKTSFISFITWVLFDQTLDFGKNNDMNLDSYNSEDLISGYIVLANEEEELTFKREYGTNYRGIKVNLFYINDRKAPQKEYFSMINKAFNLMPLEDLNIKGFDLYKALYDPYYLPNNENMFRELISNILQLDTYSTLFEEEKYQQIKKDFDTQGRDFDKTKKYYKQQLEQIDKDLLITTSAINELKSLEFNKEEYFKLLDKKTELAQQVCDIQQPLTLEKQKEILKRNEDNTIEYEKKRTELAQNSRLKLEYVDVLKEKYAKYKQEELDNQKTQQELFRKCQQANIDYMGKRDYVERLEKNIVDNTTVCPHCKKEFVLLGEDIKTQLAKEKEQLKEYKLTFDTALANYRNYKPTDHTEEEKSILEEIETKENEIREAYEKDMISITEEYDKQKQSILEEAKSLENERIQLVQELNSQVETLSQETKAMFETKTKIDTISIHKENKKVLLENKSTYELRLRLLEDLRNDEIKLIENQTKSIFGEDLTFNLLEKYKTTDNFKLVCHASVDGLDHSRFNTARYLEYSILILEKIKKFIGIEDMPIIFDIADNIGKTARENIFKSIKNSQVFYTRIADEDNVKRQLKIIETKEN